MAGDNRRQVSRQHLELLTQYMEKFPPLALASARSREGQLQSRRLWERIARTLNRLDPGVHRSGRNWARYWADLKFKLRRKYSLLRREGAVESAGGAARLNALERRMLRVLSDEHGNLLNNTSAYYHNKSYMPVDNEQSLLEPRTEHVEVTEPGYPSDDNQSDEYLGQDPEHVTVPLSHEPPDVKPNVKEPDPIRIAPHKKSVEELQRELLEFDLRRQRENHEVETQYRTEKHELEMSILRIKRQLLERELKKASS